MSSQPPKSPITCHVLDTVAGTPAQGLTCNLDKLTPEGTFQSLSVSRTNLDGRCLDLLPPDSELEAGTYKITFGTLAYFTALGRDTFFPFVEVTFIVKDPKAHYHVPLLLSPYSYTTYRGS